MHRCLAKGFAADCVHHRNHIWGTGLQGGIKGPEGQAAFEGMVESVVHMQQCELETKGSCCCLGIWNSPIDMLHPQQAEGRPAPDILRL